MVKDTLLYALHRLVFNLDRQSDDALRKKLGFSYSFFKILIGIKHSSGLTQLDIAKFLGQTEASVSRQLKTMSKQGVIKVRIDVKNRRRHHVVLTPKGRELVNEAIAVLDAEHAVVFGSLGYNEQSLMKEFIDRLTTKAAVKK